MLCLRRYRPRLPLSGWLAEQREHAPHRFKTLHLFRERCKKVLLDRLSFRLRDMHVHYAVSLADNHIPKRGLAIILCSNQAPSTFNTLVILPTLLLRLLLLLLLLLLLVLLLILLLLLLILVLPILLLILVIPLLLLRLLLLLLLLLLRRLLPLQLILHFYFYFYFYYYYYYYYNH